MAVVPMVSTLLNLQPPLLLHFIEIPLINVPDVEALNTKTTPLLIGHLAFTKDLGLEAVSTSAGKQAFKYRAMITEQSLHSYVCLFVYI